MLGTFFIQFINPGQMVPDHINTFEKLPAIIGLQHYHMDIKWPNVRNNIDPRT